MPSSSPELLSFHSRAVEMSQSCRRSGEPGCAAGALLRRYRRAGCQGIAATVAALVVLLDQLSALAQQDDINSRLVALGFSVQLPLASRLVPGRWLRAGGAEVFFRLHVPEGSASYENFGDLSVRCPDGHRVTIDVRGRGLELGEDAWAFWVPDEPVLAISVHGDDGGEGATDHFVNTVVVDVPALCAGRRGIAGPIAGRNVGP